MEGRPFHEPTQELSFIRNLSGGRFAALLIPTAVHGVQRWQVFAHNDATGRIDSFNVEQSREGLFNLQGTQAWTSPDPAYRDAVYERTPGACPFTGEPLVPLVATEGRAGTALAFEPHNYVKVPQGPALAGTDFTIEFWTRQIRGLVGDQFLIGHGHEGGRDRETLHIGLRGNNTFVFALYGDDLNTGHEPTSIGWTHWACVFEHATRQQIVYENGQEVARRTAGGTYNGSGPLLIGRALGRSAYSEMDEVRVWNRARPADEIKRDHAVRLIGNDPGLVAYYRFDEGSGSRLFDQTDNALHGDVVGTPVWITSQAPVADHPGVRRGSFQIPGRQVVSGLSALLYHQQEDTGTGYGKEAKPAKRQARVLLSYATSGPDPQTGATDGEACLATVDFGVGRDGRLAEVRDELNLPVLAAPEASTDVEKISDVDARVQQLVREVAVKEEEAERLKRETDQIPALETAAAQAQARLDSSPHAWRFRVRFRRQRDGKAQYLAVRGDGNGQGRYPGVFRTADGNASSARWQLDRVPGNDYDGLPCYYVVNAATGKDLNVSGQRTDNEAPLINYQREHGAWSTMFVLRDRGEGFYTLVNRHSGRTVSAADRKGDEVFQYDTAAVVRSQEGLIALERTDYLPLPWVEQSLAEIKNAQDRLAELRPQRDALAAREREAAALRRELEAGRAELARLTGGLKGTDDIALPVPQLSLDRSGLSCSGALLAFARSADRPHLLDSATGNVVLYFRGLNEQFFAAYYDTKVARSTRQLRAGDGRTVTFTARDAGTDLSDTRIRIEESDPDHCRLIIERGAEKETWDELPRRAAEFSAIVNGALEIPVPLGLLRGWTAPEERPGRLHTRELAKGMVTEGTAQLATPLPAPLPHATPITVGGILYLVNGDHPAGTTALELYAGEGGPLPKPDEPVTRLRYDRRNAESTRAGAPLSAGSRLVFADPGTAAEVPIGDAPDLVRGYGCRWVADKPGRAYSFDGAQNVLALTGPGSERAAVTGDVTMEAWVNPERVTGPARLLTTGVGEAPCTLGLLPPDGTDAPEARALSFDGNRAIATTQGDPGLANTDFTVEFWARRGVAPNGRNHIMIGHGPTTGQTRAALHIGFRPDNCFTFAFYGDDLNTPQKYTDTDWHHWACVYTNATREQLIYRDGQQVARRVTSGPYTGSGVFSFGSTHAGFVADYARVDMDEVRLWGTARSAAEVRAAMDQRVRGTEPGLLGAWAHSTPAPQVAGRAGVADRSPHQRHAEFRPAVATAAAPPALARKESGYRVVAGVGNRLVVSRADFPPRQWTHLAAAYEQSWAVRLADGAHLEAADDDALDVTGDLTVELSFRADHLGSTQGLLSKGRAADGAGGSVPYRLLVLPDGKLEFAFEEADGRLVRHTSPEAVKAGVFHRVAVVRKSGRSLQERKGTQEISAAGADGKPAPQTVELVESVDTREWQDIRFYLDGREAGAFRYQGPGPQGNSGALDIGRAREGMDTHTFTGVLAEVRLWSTARDAARLGTPVSPHDRGLTAHWRLEENAGNSASDSTGSHPARLRGAQWTRNPDPRGSVFRLYRNGVSIACDPLDGPVAGGFGDYGDPVLSLGARQQGGRTTHPFRGVLEEVRLWRTARTQEQVLDNLFTRLKGEKQDLIAYWPFDRASTEASAELVGDEGLRGLHLALFDGAFRPTAVLSTAPVSSDTAQVRSALAAMRTPFHEKIAGSPAVTEYADMQYTAKGEAFGVLKRAYGCLQDGRWQLVTGYKVGDLVSEWVSQVQFDPQLIGYVEGAPPVPSENLTAGISDPDSSTFDGATAVELTQAEQVVHSLSSAKERSVDAAFSFALSNEVDVDMWMITAPLGFGVAKSLVKANVSVGVRGSLEFSNSWGEETAVSQGQNTTRATKVSLSGHWEDPLKPLNAALGRRYVPANTGFAVVQSQTADVFALRLAHTGALVTYRIQPSPDIPKDWNVIPFPLNPRYTKQGTLDGAVGADERGRVLDPDYTGARGRGEYSYYKPREAYAIKRRIQRDQQRMRSYYESVSTDTHTPDPTAERAGRVVGGAIGSDASTDRSRGTEGSATGDGFARRDLVNTYVWTADGGFFAETTETTDAVSETTSGSYSLSGSVGASVGTSFEIAGVGVNAQMDASIGGGMTQTRARGREASRSFGLNVQCAPSGNLQQYDSGRKPVFDADGKPVKAPGKVDAYRFLSFYLGEDTAHFDTFFHQVVDPAWLAAAGDPNAVALRQARNSDRKPPCWRVLHRVTFVSRVLPPEPAQDAQPLETAMRNIDVESNYELVRRLDPYVKTAATGLASLTDAVRIALAAHLPELSPHSAAVTEFLAQYYGIQS